MPYVGGEGKKRIEKGDGGIRAQIVWGKKRSFFGRKKKREDTGGGKKRRNITEKKKREGERGKKRESKKAGKKSSKCKGGKEKTTSQNGPLLASLPFFGSKAERLSAPMLSPQRFPFLRAVLVFPAIMALLTRIRSSSRFKIHFSNQTGRNKVRMPKKEMQQDRERERKIRQSTFLM